MRLGTPSLLLNGTFMASQRAEKAKRSCHPMSRLGRGGSIEDHEQGNGWIDIGPVILAMLCTINCKKYVDHTRADQSPELQVDE
jgi:hypothetical protein